MIATPERVRYHGTGSGPRQAPIHTDLTSWGLVRQAVGRFRIQRAWSIRGWAVIRLDPAYYCTAMKTIANQWEVANGG